MGVSVWRKEVEHFANACEETYFARGGNNRTLLWVLLRLRVRLTMDGQTASIATIIRTGKQGR